MTPLRWAIATLVLALAAKLAAAQPGQAHRRLRAAAARASGGGGVSAVQSASLPGELGLELMAALLDSGVPMQGATSAVAPVVSDPAFGTWVQEIAQLSLLTGLPTAALLRTRAADLRRERRTVRAIAARRLAVLLVLPTGLALLPAFVLLTVVPLILDVVRT